MTGCAYCGGPEQGRFAIHRDGEGLGPEVPLCDACGGGDTPTQAEIWARISTMVSVENAVVFGLVQEHAPELLVQDRAPAWLVVAAMTHVQVAWWSSGQDFGDLVARLRDDPGLQDAIVAAHRFDAKGFEIMDLITNWRAES